MEVDGQQIVMPKSYEKVSFKHHFKKLRCSFVVYADFECLTEDLKKPDEDEDKNTFSYQIWLMLLIIQIMNLCIVVKMLLMCFVKNLMTLGQK